MNELFKEIFHKAKATANELLDKADNILNDSQTSTLELEDLRMTVDKLEAYNDTLEVMVDDLTGALQVLLDGDMRKDLTISLEKYNELRNHTLSMHFTEENKYCMTIHLVQEKISD